MGLVIVLLLVSAVNLLVALASTRRHAPRSQSLKHVLVAATLGALALSYAEGAVGILGRVLTVMSGLCTVGFSTVWMLGADRPSV